MNLTISVLEGLLLLLPGLAALTAWNFIGARSTARRPELPLTAVNALAVVLLITVATHLIGTVVAQLVVQAAAEWNADGFPSLPALSNPYSAALGLLADRPSTPPGSTFFALLTLLLMESLVVVRIVRSRGVNLAFASYDLRGVGWAHKHCLEPLAHGYTPVAFVMLKALDKARGLGYAGPIDDLRFGAQGELASISLGRPQRFVYEVRAGTTGRDRVAGSQVLREALRGAELMRNKREWVGGVVHLAAADIHNIVVHTFSPTEIRAFNAGQTP